MLPPNDESTHKPRFVENGKLKDAADIRQKVAQDIAFLSDRIANMKRHPKPNVQLIEHYESMLKSRQSVLNWLLDGCDEDTKKSHLRIV